MSVVAQGNQTVSFIRSLVRELTASPGENQLATSYIDQTLNNFIASDFPNAIKSDLLRDVYSFYTAPYIDRYPLDVNYNQSVRGPVYVDGYQGYLAKDREQFFATWPKLPTLWSQYGSNSLQGAITAITQAANAQVTSSNHGLTTGKTIYINGVLGMTQVNNIGFTVTVVDANNYTIGVNSTGYGAYTGGGSWNLTPVTFNFTVPGPILSLQVTIGGTDINGNPITIADDGNGNLQLKTPNPVISIPAQTTNPALPGLYNLNTGNPGLYNVKNIGSVNYVTGAIFFTNPLPLQTGTTLTVWVSQYQVGRPYSLLFWNNEFTIRPIPKLIHKVTVETYLTPVQFMLSTDVPILAQWSQYISYGCAVEILRRRQDMAGVQNLMEGFKRQESLVLERQASEEINSRNATIFSSSTPSQQGFNNNFWGGY